MVEKLLCQFDIFTSTGGWRKLGWKVANKGIIFHSLFTFCFLFMTMGRKHRSVTIKQKIISVVVVFPPLCARTSAYKP